MARRSKPKLVTQYLENISREGFEKYAHIIRAMVGKRMGIYALFRRGKLYYVGLASDLRFRLKGHMKNRHRNSWDTFSVYLTIGDSHLRELESLVLRITQPPGNKQLGKFSGAQDIRRHFNRQIARTQRMERDRILGRDSNESDGGDDGRKRSFRIRARYKGVLYKARFRRDGRVRWNKKLYSSVSAAATAIRKRNTNGWAFFKYERSPGDWVKLSRMRD
ncbi:MAG TPA: hypothetical protein VEJ63_03915 [Planctomycetota bacterium]|nr:hypothetical protein [Planctomycetota bacterium]